MTSDRISRGWWLAATLAVAAFAAYVSLVPFRFTRPPHAMTIEYVRMRMVDRGWLSHSNLAANALMLLPLGFFGAATLVQEGARAWQRVLAACVVLAASIALSVTIETLQIFVPGRTPSLADVEAQTVGTVVGVIGWMVLGRETAVWSARFVSGSRRSLEAALFGYAVIQTFWLLHPLDVTVEPSNLARKFRHGGIVVNPLHSPALHWAALPSMLADFLFATPIGVLAAIAGRDPGTRRSAAAAVAIGALFFGAGEVAQIFVQSRTADVVDFAANACGVVAGVVLAAMFISRPARSDASSRSAATTRGAFVALVLAAAVYTAYNLSPFDFVISRGQMIRRAGMLAGVPFYAYYENPEFKALGDAILKLSLAAPLGVFFQLGWRPDETPFRRSLVAGWLALTGLFFTAVEIGQIFVPSRYPDNSDILTGIFAVWLGMRLTRPFTRPRTGSR
jgi:VanZ family protein